MFEENKEKNKRQISVILTDIDNVNKTLEGLDNLFKEILTHYAITNMGKLKLFLFSIASYIGTAIKLMGWDEDFLEKE